MITIVKGNLYYTTFRSDSRTSWETFIKKNIYTLFNTGGVYCMRSYNAVASDKNVNFFNALASDKKYYFNAEASDKKLQF